MAPFYNADASIHSFSRYVPKTFQQGLSYVLSVWHTLRNAEKHRETSAKICQRKHFYACIKHFLTTFRNHSSQTLVYAAQNNLC